MSNKESSFSVEHFYDSLSSEYHFVYADWYESMEIQSKKLDRLIKENSIQSSKTILDCSCGIGTQAIGLAKLGYKVFATDLSSKSIERATFESEKMNVPVSFDVVDMKELEQKVAGRFDVVLSCDNSLPHILEDDDLVLVGKNILSKLNSAGIFIGSIRDYDRLLQRKQRSTNPVVSVVENKKTITFQLWNWKEDNTYIVNHYTVKEQNGVCETTLRKTKYRVYTRKEITNCFLKAGFGKVDWLMPDESGFYQPIILARK